MKTYKEFTDEQLDEGVIFGIAIERKLKAALTKVKATDNTNEKIDILMKALHFSIGSLAFELQKSRKRR